MNPIQNFIVCTTDGGVYAIASGGGVPVVPAAAPPPPYYSNHPAAVRGQQHRQVHAPKQPHQRKPFSASSGQQPARMLTITHPETNERVVESPSNSKRLVITNPKTKEKVKGISPPAKVRDDRDFRKDSARKALYESVFERCNDTQERSSICSTSIDLNLKEEKRCFYDKQQLEAIKTMVEQTEWPYQVLEDLVEVGIKKGMVPPPHIPSSTTAEGGEVSKERRNTTVAVVTRKFGHNAEPNFKPDWLAQPSLASDSYKPRAPDRFRKPYCGRSSDNSTALKPYTGRSSDNSSYSMKAPVARQSLDQRPSKQTQLSLQQADSLPKKSATAWKSRREEFFDRSAPVRDEEEIKYEKMRKEVRGLLNKITPTTCEDLMTDFLAYKIHEDPKGLVIIIDLIFDKAVEEPHFCPLYSDLCKTQVEVEQQALAGKPPQHDKTFRNEIIKKCQNTFLASNKFDDKITELKKKIDELEEGDTKGRAALDDEIELRRSKEKRRLLGIIRFIAQLYRHQLLVDKIINWCSVELIKRFDATKDEVYIEYAVELLETVGKVYEKREQENPSRNRTIAQVTSDAKGSFTLDKIFEHLSILKKSLSNRIRFAIMDLEDLRKNNWVPRGGEKGPKTINEIREDLEKEQEENELERIEHEKQKKVQILRRPGTSYGPKK